MPCLRVALQFHNRCFVAPVTARSLFNVQPLLPSVYRLPNSVGSSIEFSGNPRVNLVQVAGIPLVVFISKGI